MRLQITMLVLMTLVSLVISATASSSQPQGFERRVASYEDEEDYDGQAQTHIGYRSRLYDYSNEQEEVEEPPQRTSPTYSRNNNNKPQQKQQTYPKKVKSISSEELEEEEEPDRLALFLAKSTFGCDGKVTGYYADDTVGCEVFHYCQDNQRHSWICPEGFTFHQVHLICMPPSHENICEQSQKYHVVNNYLYKPINLEEHQSKPNVSLRYSERYFPEDIYEDQRYHYESRQDRERVQHHHQRQPVQVGFQHQSLHQQQQQQQPIQIQQVQQPQRVTQPARHNLVQQQFQNRKTAIQQPTQQIHTSPIPYTQTIITPAPSPQPTPYRFATQVTNHPQQHQAHQQVFRSPEEINISLQQRRPQIFIATSTPRYYEDEYSYERRK